MFPIFLDTFTLSFAKEIVNNYSKPSLLQIEDGNMWVDKSGDSLENSLLAGLVVYENKNPDAGKLGESFLFPMTVIYQNGQWKFFHFAWWNQALTRRISRDKN